jgi:uncharacterized protein YjbI with pentapeptide repeats
MRKWLRSPWVIGIIVVLVVFIGLTYRLRWGWTGFSTKTLWDWLQLLSMLAIPVVAGFGVAWYTTKQTQASEAATDRQHHIEQEKAKQQHDIELEKAERQHQADIETANQRHKAELEITVDNQRETALQAYIDQISKLLLHEHLGEASANPQVQNIAQARTATALRILDPERRGSLILFLSRADILALCVEKAVKGSFEFPLNNEYGLANIDLHSVNLNGVNFSNLHLEKANLEKASLEQANLQGTDLSGANLKGANLTAADLQETNLTGANLQGARLFMADLQGANLMGANLEKTIMHEVNLKGAGGTTNEQLSKAHYLQGATMPDGSKHP